MLRLVVPCAHLTVPLHLSRHAGAYWETHPTAFHAAWVVKRPRSGPFHRHQPPLLPLLAALSPKEGAGWRGARPPAGGESMPPFPWDGGKRSRLHATEGLLGMTFCPWHHVRAV